MKNGRRLFITVGLGAIAFSSSAVSSRRECQELLLPSKDVMLVRSARASEYLDKRASNWVSDHSCISCHTIIPFVVGRTGLNALEAEAFNSIQKLVVKRVSSTTPLAPWYGAERTRSSYATESVLNSLILVQIDALKLARKPSAVTVTAFKKMKEMQNEDGSWEWLDFNLQPWETHEAAPFGTSLAAIAVSRSSLRSDVQFETMISKMKRYLKASAKNQNLSLWNRVSILWANSEMKGIISAETLNATLAELMAKQLPDGGWSMNNFGNWQKRGTQPAAKADAADGYASAYSLFVLKQLNEHGQIPANQSAKFNAVFQDGLNWLVDHQTTEGIWPSASLNSDNEFNRKLVEDAAAGFGLAVLNR